MQSQPHAEDDEDPKREKREPERKSDSGRVPVVLTLLVQVMTLSNEVADLLLRLLQQ